MNKNELTLITELREKGLDKVADAAIAILEERDTRVFDLQVSVEETKNRYEMLSSAMDQFLRAHDDRIKEVHTAFPNEDLHGHRKYHDRLLDAADAEKKFWDDLKLDLVKKGTWSVLIILTGLIVTGISVKMGWSK